MNRVLKCNEYLITQYFSNKHKALDMVGRKNNVSITCPIIAHSDGKVVWEQTGIKHDPKIKPGTNASYGNAVKIKHSDGYYTLYAHMKSVYVKKGQYVKQGQEIGYMGDTGIADGFHLHWEVRQPNETRINPLPYLKANLPNMNDKKYQTYDNVKKYWLPLVEVGSNGFAGNYGNSCGGLRNYNGGAYRVHLLGDPKDKWLDWVVKTNDTNSGYAGIKGKKIDGVQIKNATYRVHLLGKPKDDWLDWVSKVDDTKDGYAGVYGYTIDCIQIK
jgi:hypothetical protein